MEIKNNREKTLGFFGGKLEHYETPRDACSREVFEETAFQIDEFDGMIKLEYKRSVWMFLKMLEDEFMPTLSPESYGFAWLDELPTNNLHPMLVRNSALISRCLELLRKL